MQQTGMRAGQSFQPDPPAQYQHCKILNLFTKTQQQQGRLCYPSWKQCPWLKNHVRFIPDLIVLGFDRSRTGFIHRRYNLQDLAPVAGVGEVLSLGKMGSYLCRLPE